MHQHRTLDRARDRGFSFIELLAYMAIAALLILAAVPQFSAYRERALISNLQNDVRNASLAAEASLIASKSGRTAPGVMQLASTASDGASTAPAPGTFAALSAAVKATKLSDSASTLATIDTGAGEYEIRGTNPKTERMVVFASAMNGASGFEQGLSLVDASSAPPVAGGGQPTTPEAPVATTACGPIMIPNKAPAATVLGTDFTKTWGVGKYRDSFSVYGELKQGQAALFPIESGTVAQAANLRVWFGNEPICMPSDAMLVFTDRPASQGQTMSLDTWTNAEAFLTAEQVSSTQPVTVQFDYRGATHVLRMDYEASRWTQVDGYVEM